RRPAADENYAIRISGECLLGAERGADLDDRAVRIGELRHRALRLRPHQDDMAARHVPEALDVCDELVSFCAFPRQHAVQAELTALADGAHGTNVGHDTLPDRCRARLSRLRARAECSGSTIEIVREGMRPATGNIVPVPRVWVSAY